MASQEWNKAKRNYFRGIAFIMASYCTTLFGMTTYVHRWHPQGGRLYLAAALQSFPIFCMIVIIARYLREETDEYERDNFVKCMLFGTAVTLGLSVFMGFLQSFGWSGKVPAFTEFVTFWLSVGIAKCYFKIADSRLSDE